VSDVRDPPRSLSALLPRLREVACWDEAAFQDGVECRGKQVHLVLQLLPSAVSWDCQQRLRRHHPRGLEGCGSASELPTWQNDPGVPRDYIMICA